MEPFTSLVAVAAPILRDNIDTDAIIPSREIRSVSKTGLAAGLFAGWRYSSIEARIPNPEFVLNSLDYAGAKILVAGANFGCGSSREHAVWALAEFGFRVLIASSFNPIFFRNCLRNGVLPAVLSRDSIEAIAAQVARDPRRNRLTVDLAAQTITVADGEARSFALPADARDALLSGRDAIDQTLRLQDRIQAFRDADRAARPWVYGVERR